MVQLLGDDLWVQRDDESDVQAAVDGDAGQDEVDGFEDLNGG